jgi:hypothetical protein
LNLERDLVVDLQKVAFNSDGWQVVEVPVFAEHFAVSFPPAFQGNYFSLHYTLPCHNMNFLETMEICRGGSVYYSPHTGTTPH